MNKKIITSISFLIFFCVLLSSSQAQNFSIGLRGGVNYSTMLGSDIQFKITHNSQNYTKPSGIKAKLGLNLGALLNYKIKKRLNVTAEVNFTEKGTKIKDYDISIHYNYVEIPVYVSYLLTKDTKLSPKVFGGRSVGILMRAKVKDAKNEVVYLEDALKKIDLGLILGLGVNIPVNKKHSIYSDIRYTLGANTAFQEEDIPIRNGVLSFNLAYLIPIGKKKVEEKSE